MPIARLHLITPDDLDESVVARTEAAVAAGVTWLQVRVKTGTDRQRWDATRRLAACCGPEMTVIVDDRVDFAAALGAGVHLGSDDLPVAVARSVLGVDAIVGATVRNAESARRAEAEGASYLGVGPVFATSTKTVAHAPLGASGLAEVAAAVTIPVIAIAGITHARIGEVMAAGAHGVAVVSAVYDHPFVSDAVNGFLRILEQDAAA